MEEPEVISTIVVKVTHERSVTATDLCVFIENLVIDLADVKSVDAKPKVAR